MFMLTAWVMGIGIGLIFTFLFWHLQDYGGHPTIFGIASVINHISEMGAYFYSFKIISQYGHVKVLMVGLLGNVIRFIYISFITWPWLVLPFEFLQGKFKVNSTKTEYQVPLVCRHHPRCGVGGLLQLHLTQHRRGAEAQHAELPPGNTRGGGKSFKKKLIFRESIMVLADSAEPFLVGC